MTEFPAPTSSPSPSPNRSSGSSSRSRSGFANTDPSVVIGHFPWYEMLWRSLRGDFKPRTPPSGGYAQFAREWSTPVDVPRLQQRPQQPVVTWLGHVSVLLQMNGLNILTDPTLAPFAGPFGRFGAPRMVPAPLPARALPPIDILLISHNHYDHLCSATLQTMVEAGQQPQIFVPLGLKAWFDARRIPHVTELDWWQSATVGDFRIHLTPAQHWSRRGLRDTNQTLWGGYCVEHLKPDAAPWRFLFPGDTGYSNDFKTIRERIGAIDFLALPVGAYLPRDFMKPMHVNPEDAVQMLLDLDARQAMGVHWGTFQLTQEPFDQPPRDLAAALQARGLAADRVWLLRHGETRAIP